MQINMHRDRQLDKKTFYKYSILLETTLSHKLNLFLSEFKNKNEVGGNENRRDQVVEVGMGWRKRVWGDMNGTGGNLGEGGGDVET